MAEFVIVQDSDDRIIGQRSTRVVTPPSDPGKTWIRDDDRTIWNDYRQKLLAARRSGRKGPIIKYINGEVVEDSDLRQVATITANRRKNSTVDAYVLDADGEDQVVLTFTLVNRLFNGDIYVFFDREETKLFKLHFIDGVANKVITMREPITYTIVGQPTLKVTEEVKVIGAA